MSTYTFADLLNIFFRLQRDDIKYKTHDDLAKELKVSRRTIAGWFAGDYTPRSPDVIERIARVLCLTAFQVDLLFYSVNPDWIKYGTPRNLLETAEIVRYREENIAQLQLKEMPSIAQIEREWSLVVADQFERNHKRWSVGMKENGICQIERRLGDKRYTLTLQNQYHEDVFMGGDSSILAPAVYYMTITARTVQGDTDDDGYGIMFEEISDECYAFFRIREKHRRISVVQTFTGGDQAKVYLRQLPAPSIRIKEMNKLAILAIQQDHWFYVNDVLVGQCVIPRLSIARLDVGIVAGYQQKVVCIFQDFRIYVPAAGKLYPHMENILNLPIE